MSPTTFVVFGRLSLGPHPHVARAAWHLPDVMSALGIVAETTSLRVRVDQAALGRPKPYFGITRPNNQFPTARRTGFKFASTFPVV